MNEYMELFERAGARYQAPSLTTDDLLLRRDRKQRNQRLRAGAVGVAVFLAAVWIVTNGVGLMPRTTTQVPEGDPAPAVTGPPIGPTGNPYSVGEGLPPAGTPPSEPVSGELVLQKGGIHPYYTVNVYADGRLIWARDAAITGDRPWEGRLSEGFVLASPPEGFPAVSGWIEQRLTPGGVELLRSGAVKLGGQFENPAEQLPMSAWVDPELSPYVPLRYAACLWGGINTGTSEILPAWAQEALSRPDLHNEDGYCPEISLEEARAILEILRDQGFEVLGGSGYVGAVAVVKGSGFGSTLNFRGSAVEFVPLLPDGRFAMTGG